MLLAREVLRDRVPLDEAGEQALAEQLHHRFGVPALERVKGAVVREAAIGQREGVRADATGPSLRRWRRRRRFRAGSLGRVVS